MRVRDKIGEIRSAGSARVGSLRTDVLALNGSLGGTEAQTNVLVPSPTALARPGGLDLGRAVEEDYGVVVVSFGLLANSLLQSDTAFARKNSLCGCFWKARSLWTVSSVAILSVGRGPRWWLGEDVGVFVGNKIAAPEFCVDFSWCGLQLHRAKGCPT